LLTVSGTCAKEVAGLVPDRVVECVEDRRERWMSDAELRKAKRMITVNAIEQLQTVKGLASDLGLNWLYARNLEFSRQYLNRLQAVSVADVERVVAHYLTDASLTVAVLRPASHPKQVSIRTDKSANPQLHVLSNGARAVLVPDQRLPMVYSSAVFRGGSLNETAEDNGVHQLLAQAMPKGTKSRSAEQIAEEIEGRGSLLSVESGYNTLRISVGSLSADIADAFDVLIDVAGNPVFPPEATERERESQIASIRAEQAQPHLVARNLLRKEIYGSHPYGLNPLGREETVLKIARTQLIRRHRECFVWPNAVFGFCGRFDPQQILDMIEAQLQNLHYEQPSADHHYQAVKNFKSRVVTSHEGRHQAVVYIGFLSCTMTDPDRVSLELLDEATGDSSSRFFVKVREERGLAYSVGSSLFLGIAPGIFSVHAATAPEKVESVSRILSTELERLAGHGLEQEEFDRAKTRTLSQLAFQLQNMDAYAHSVALNEFYGLGYDYLHRRKKQIESLTMNSVNEAARKYLMDKPAITVIVRP
jgi:zinc protease